MENNKKFWFFGSKLNTALLLILIILMVIALRFMYQNKETYLPIIDQKNTPKEIQQVSENQTTKEYKNDQLGFSFEYPSICGDIKVTENSNKAFQAAPTNADRCPLGAIFGVTKDYIPEFEECGLPAPFDPNRATADSSESVYQSGSGVNFLSQYGVSLSNDCGPEFGRMRSLFNLKHSIPAIEFYGFMSWDFMHIMYSVKVY